MLLCLNYLHGRKSIAVHICEISTHIGLSTLPLWPTCMVTASMRARVRTIDFLSLSLLEHLQPFYTCHPSSSTELIHSPFHIMSELMGVSLIITYAGLSLLGIVSICKFFLSEIVDVRRRNFAVFERVLSSLRISWVLCHLS